MPIVGVVDRGAMRDELSGGVDRPRNIGRRGWYFGGNGWLRTGWVQLGKGTGEPDGNSAKHWSYFGPNGWLRTGWQKMGTKENPDGNSKVHYSYFGAYGWLVTGKQVIDGKTYIFNSSGWRL